MDGKFCEGVHRLRTRKYTKQDREFIRSLPTRWYKDYKTFLNMFIAYFFQIASIEEMHVKMYGQNVIGRFKGKKWLKIKMSFSSLLI